MGRFQMYCKEDEERGADKRWLGVIALMDDEKRTGEVIDVALKPTLEELEAWFTEREIQYG